MYFGAELQTNADRWMDVEWISVRMAEDEKKDERN